MNNSTQLTDRVLWYDGDSVVDPECVLKLINNGVSLSGICVDQLTDQLKQYNKFSTQIEQVSVKTQSKELRFDWVLPQYYKELVVYDKLTDQLVQYCVDNNIVDANIINDVIERVDSEYKLFEKHDKVDVLRTMYYIVDTLTTGNVMWGIGRGSSVSSFILYLIGVHDVDSYRYQLDITDFLS